MPIAPHVFKGYFVKSWGSGEYAFSGNKTRRQPNDFALLLCLMFIDTHVHFDRFVKDGTFGEVLERAKEAQLHEMVAIGGTAEANALSLKLAEEHPGRIFGCAGYDRDEATNNNDFAALKGQVADPLVKAVGETGLDYYYTAETAAEQKKLFAENLALAIEFEKPWWCIRATPTRIPLPCSRIMPRPGKGMPPGWGCSTVSRAIRNLPGRCSISA